jgi:quinoprotein glucose dehydrogenase
MTTAGGLTFVAANADRHIRAFDTKAGPELWRGDLPESAQSTPISYASAASGRQFVVISAGGGITLTPKRGQHLLAYALPQASRKAAVN